MDGRQGQSFPSQPNQPHPLNGLDQLYREVEVWVKRSIWRGASQLPRYGSRLMDHWACYREIMYIHLMCEGSSLLSNIICSVLDVKSFYLSHQQHLNQLDTAVRYLTYRMYQHEVSVMSSLVKSWLTDLWNCFWMIGYIYRISCGSSLLSNKICSVLDAKSFYLSHQQHLNQLEAAVRYLTYMIYLHVISVMIGVMLTLTT